MALSVHVSSEQSYEYQQQKSMEQAEGEGNFIGTNTGHKLS